MTEKNNYKGIALDGPLKGQVLVSQGELCIERDERWWRKLIFGPSPPYAYKYSNDGWWVYDGTRSY
ncbi:hypothetical protein SAMN05444273_109115 [Litoreibacter ascidiaceicola]|uniref:Uncharacterized protein n=1 Tax=Litoreibacter ascidiaceicola TaxID=1486859 RepID=A0A1M5DMW2_9RHOB|nr:hypothetical protein [Litoreibacter ascidiaceicola]SHF68235.1 hypothetical protein SAMN05444273_109115 [Litoreibacter ascidiaceicola]